jgi:predicted RNA-binding Zn ribbon-like protein
MNRISEVIPTQAHAFRPRDLVGGHVVIDLVNTVNARDGDPEDWLDGYPRLLEWAELTDSFEPGALRRLERHASRDLAGAARALRSIKELREALHGILSAIGEGEPPPEDDVRRLERSWKGAVAHGRIDVSSGEARIRVEVKTSGLTYLEHELAIRAIELLWSLPRERTRVCAGPRCGWLFVDRSKAGRRRWCDMATCGNAAKSRRHYQRSRASVQVAGDGQGESSSYRRITRPGARPTP